MPLSPRGVRVFSLAACACATLTGCFGNGTTTTTPPAANPFTNVVFIGDSLTAGFQNGSLLDTQQPHGYASLVATQANFTITLPLIAPPGAPAVLQLYSTSFPPVVVAESGVTTGRDNPTAQPTDLAVPGHELHDIINTGPTLIPTNSEAVITDFVLGFPVGNTNPQLAEAVALKPSTVFVWAGSDDALQADESGLPSSMTSLASFTSDFTQLMTTLKATSANLIVANVPDVTAIPYLTPAATLVTDISATTGIPAATVSAALGITAGDLVNAQGLTDTEADITAIQGGKAPTPLPATDYLTPTQIATVQANINAYNQVIAQQVSAVGGTLVDLHSYFATLAAGVTINGYNATETFLGGIFGLDGIHPTNTGYALVANQFIAALNTKFSMSIPVVNVSTVAAADPYFGPNIKPLIATHIPVTAAQRADELIRGFKPKR